MESSKIFYGEVNKLIIMDVFLGRTETLVNNKYEKLTNTATENLGK